MPPVFSVAESAVLIVVVVASFVAVVWGVAWEVMSMFDFPTWEESIQPTHATGGRLESYVVGRGFCLSKLTTSGKKDAWLARK